MKRVYNLIMNTPILATKLFIPDIRTELVRRTRLIDKLNEGLQRKLNLVSAPAGFGKTTLVSEWVGNLRMSADKDNKIVNRIFKGTKILCYQVNFVAKNNQICFIFMVVEQFIELFQY